MATRTAQARSRCRECVRGEFVEVTLGQTLQRVRVLPRTWGVNLGCTMRHGENQRPGRADVRPPAFFGATGETVWVCSGTEERTGTTVRER